MKNLSIIAVSLLLGLGACGNKFDKAISEAEGFKDKMCACKDKDCAEKVDADFKSWNKEMKEKFGKDDKPNEDQMKKVMEVQKAYRECERKAEGETPPGAAVDTPTQPATKTE